MDNTKKSNKQAKSVFKYKERHAVIIEVESEIEQRKLFEHLKSKGYKNLKIVSV